MQEAYSKDARPGSGREAEHAVLALSFGGCVDQPG
jgi:hypothetical protein